MDITEKVEHPQHYNQSPAKCIKCGQSVECIDIIEHMPFNRGNAIKYLWRAEDKGELLQDLRKARWYIDREITRVSNTDPIRKDV